MLDQTDATRVRPRFETVPMLPLECHGLAYANRGRTLVDGVSLRLERGPRTVVMGPNGAGKSLLLRMLHGIVQPSSGAVTWAGDVASEAVRAKQAMVFQRPTLLRRSVEANIRFVLRGLDASKRASERHKFGPDRAFSISLRRPRGSCPVASSNGWPWLALWRSIPRSCSWTSPAPVSIPLPHRRSKS